MSARFPMPMPAGWYCVAYSDELAPGEVKSVRYFGRELVLARTESGKAMVTDPHCPHLGAHMAAGKIIGERIACPFHGWEFGVEGRCERIPYDERIPSKARLQTWLHEERDGFLFVYFDPANRSPRENRVPSELGDSKWRGIMRRKEWTIRTHPQELFENGLDTAHFEFVHGIGQPLSSDIHEFDDGTWSAHHRYERGLFGLRMPADLTIRYCEPGVHLTTVEIGRLAVFIVAAVTPIDEETQHQRVAYFGSANVPWPIREAMVSLLAFETSRQFEQDIPIWESKVYLENPVLCSNDGDIARIRRWFAQFY